MSASPEPRQLLLVWETDYVPAGENAARLVARRPVKEMSVAAAAKTLSMSAWSVRHLWRVGELSGYKPGAIAERRDGRESNARLVLDAESVLRYKVAQQERAKRFQDS